MFNNSRIDNKMKQNMTHRLGLLSLFFLLPVLGWAQTSITSLSEISNSSGNYIITADINGGTAGVSTFSGTLEAEINPNTKMPYRIKNLAAPLFSTLTGTVKNLVLEDVAISGHTGNTGAIACTVNGSARIYNVGILSGSVGGTGYTGGLVGLLDGQAHVINCYSYATITGGSTVAGIVGYNNVASTQSHINTTTHVLGATMVMNCMFYGDITGGTTVSPVYGGKNIDNRNSGGLSNFNYYAYSQLKTQKTTTDDDYHCTLAVEDLYLNRIEFYRQLLNSNKRLAAIYVTGNPADADLMLKWVLETADRSIANPKPYPVLKAQGYYPSIINPDIANAPDSTAVGPNKGGKLGKTLSVTISSTKSDGGQSWPSGATITTSSLTLQRTDKDFDRFNFNYDKVQLPYYNDIGTGNYTENRVVTGWKITSITPAAANDYTAANYGPTNNVYPKDYPNFNFADRKSTNKDLYTVSGRVFSQGAYFDVPYGVTSITIEPYWGKAAYLADEYYDEVYNETIPDRNYFYNGQSVSGLGTQVANGATFNGDENQTINTSALAAWNAISSPGSSVYDNAIVLVGNFHQNRIGVSPFKDNKPFTLMSVDMDNDKEPDYSLIYNDNDRTKICPIRFDFLNVPGTAQVKKPFGGNGVLNVSVVKTYGWFEITNTALLYFCQFEYENQSSFNKQYAPLILLGGYIDQFVSTQKNNVSGKTYYIHVGGNVLINAFGLGTHSDGGTSTPHVPVSVTGGEYLGFYLSGTYNQNAAVVADNAECYISGGHFVEAAGASQEQINGNVQWQIYNADIDEFYGGGTNDAKPITGDVRVDIYNSRVTQYCGGPKFGNMAANKKVTTIAEGCTFGKFFGAGYGGISYSRKKYFDKAYPDYNFNNLQRYYYSPGGSGNYNERGRYYNGRDTDCPVASYGKKGPGVATDFDYEFFVWTSGKTGARFFIKFASFSLAQCNNVESTLKKCVINSDFFGGGNLGKVEGSVTSVLDGCTVNGNAYGAGYSATLSPIEVRNQGFVSGKLPKFNNYACVFELGTLSGTTPYTWVEGTFPSEGGSGFDGQQVITDVDLGHDNLGSVSQNATLTIKGNSTVLGSVFGGGDESIVHGNTEVQILEHAKVYGNIYGGGNEGEVRGSTKVIVNGKANVIE